MSKTPQGRAIIEMQLRTGKLNAGLKRVQNNFKNTGAQVLKYGAGFSSFGVSLAAGFILAANKAGEAQEVINRFDQVFKSQSKGARTFAQDLAGEIGRSETDILDALSSYQAFFIGLGKGEEQAASLSKEITGLALDFASFNNLSDEDAQARFISGLSGSSEVFDKFGINIKSAALNQKLLELGLNKTTATATENEKVMARLAIISESLGRQGAVGDAVKTAGSYVNTKKRLTASFKDFLQNAGKPLLDTFAGIFTYMSNLIEKAGDFIKENKGIVKSTLLVAAGITAAGIALSGIGLSFITLGALVGAASAVLSTAGAALGTLATFATVAGGAVGAALGSPLLSVLVVMGLMAEKTLDLSGQIKALTGAVKSDFGVAFANAKDNFELLKNAVLAGDLILAFKIAGAALKLAFSEALDSVFAKFRELKTIRALAANDIQAGFKTAFAQVEIYALSAVLGIINTFGSMKSAWQSVLGFMVLATNKVMEKTKLAWTRAIGEINAAAATLSGGTDAGAEIYFQMSEDLKKIKNESKATAAEIRKEFGKKVDSPFADALTGEIADKINGLDKIEGTRTSNENDILGAIDIENKNAADSIKILKQQLEIYKKQLEAIKKPGKGTDKETPTNKTPGAPAIATPKFGQLAEFGSTAALKLFSGQSNPLLKEQKQTNKTLDKIAENTGSFGIV